MRVTNGTSVTAMKFYYNTAGIPTAFLYNNNTMFYYVTNLQGDVVGIADSTGTGAHYTYDAWGNILSMNGDTSVFTDVLNANPLRYRGYIYDQETGFYYLQSRY